MTKEDAIAIWILHGCPRVEEMHRRREPQHVVDKFLVDNARDVVDGLVALGLLKLDPSAGES